MSENFKLILRSANREFRHALTEWGTGAAFLRRPRPKACDDEIRPLVRSLLFGSGSRNAPRSVMFTSVEASGQSASVCIRVARAVASFDAGSVCVVDASFSSPSMHLTFGVPRDPGVAEMLERGSSSRFMTREVEPGLWLLPAGCAVLEPHGGFSLDRVKAMNDELRASFDWSLADIGPTGQAGSSTAMARSADGVVLVVAANVTRRAGALKAKQDIVDAGGRLLGAVLTECTLPISEAVYRRL